MSELAMAWETARARPNTPSEGGGRRNLDEFADAIRGFPEVLECHVLMGSVDFLLRVVAADIDAYERFFFERLSRVPGIHEVNSIVALSEIKGTTALPI
jgi:Lrp/AsnC family transcriptional regulator